MRKDKLSHNRRTGYYTSEMNEYSSMYLHGWIQWLSDNRKKKKKQVVECLIQGATISKV